MNKQRTILPRLFLASNSIRRQTILRELTVPFVLQPSPYRETIDDVAHLAPPQKAAKLAALKAFHASAPLTEGIVIGADTIVVLGTRVLGKPRDRQDAIEMLNDLSGKTHQVITGLALVDVTGLHTVTHSETTNVTFKTLSKREIEHYTETPEPYDKAGAYAIQGLASLFVEKIDGCYFNVVGFPINAFGRLLAELQIDILDYIQGAGK